MISSLRLTPCPVCVFHEQVAGPPAVDSTRAYQDPTRTGYVELGLFRVHSGIVSPYVVRNKPAKCHRLAPLVKGINVGQRAYDAQNRRSPNPLQRTQDPLFSNSKCVSYQRH
jgi:hypothetical protein